MLFIVDTNVGKFDLLGFAPAPGAPGARWQRARARAARPGPAGPGLPSCDVNVLSGSSSSVTRAAIVFGKSIKNHKQLKQRARSQVQTRMKDGFGSVDDSRFIEGSSWYGRTHCRINRQNSILKLAYST